MSMSTMRKALISVLRAELEYISSCRPAAGKERSKLRPRKRCDQACTYHIASAHAYVFCEGMAASPALRVGRSRLWRHQPQKQSRCAQLVPIATNRKKGRRDAAENDTTQSDVTAYVRFSRTTAFGIASRMRSERRILHVRTENIGPASMEGIKGIQYGEEALWLAYSLSIIWLHGRWGAGSSRTVDYKSQVPTRLV